MRRFQITITATEVGLNLPKVLARLAAVGFSAEDQVQAVFDLPVGASTLLGAQAPVMAEVQRLEDDNTYLNRPVGVD